MEISSEQNLTKKPSDDTTRKEEVLGGQGKGRGEEEVGAHWLWNLIFRYI